MKICIIVPDGIGLRNYLFSSLVDKFDVSDEIVIMTVLPETIIEEVQALHTKKITYLPMMRYKETFWGNLLKEASTYARLRFNSYIMQNSTTMINWTRKKKGFKRKTFFFLASVLGYLYRNYYGILKLETLYDNIIHKTECFRKYIDILKEMRPDVVFCTHQRSLDASVVIEAAQKLNIPTAVAIYSWDNLPKARLLVRSRFYVLWSDYMQEELRDYYPEINLRYCLVTGTPQFEFYFDKTLHQTKEEFFKNHNLNPAKKVLCFSGNDLTFPCDDLYLQDIAEELLKMPDEERPQILLRRCPVDNSGRFNKVVEKYPDLIKVSEPLWKSSDEGWDFNLPTYEDVKLLVNVILHSDAVINIGSTMAHDFAVMGKPAIYINYDQPTVQDWSAITNNQYQHFRSMPNKNCVIWLNNKTEIIDKVKHAMQENPPEVANQKKWFEIVAMHPVTKASENIVKVLKRIGQKEDIFYYTPKKQANKPYYV